MHRLYLLFILSYYICVSTGIQDSATVNETAKSISTARTPCNTPACKATARKILERVDNTTDPCDDFYQYACGKWIDTHQFLPNETVISDFWYLQLKVKKRGQALLNNTTKELFPSEVKLKTLYSQCKDEDKIERLRARPLLDFLEEHMGGWPILTPSWDASKFDIFSTLAGLFLAGSEPFFDVTVVADIVRPSANLLKIDAAYTYAGHDILQNDVTGKIYTESYLQHLFNVTKLLLKDSNQSTVDVNTFSINLTDIVGLEQEIGLARLSAVDAQNDSTLLIRMTPTELSRRYRFNSTMLHNLTGHIRARLSVTNVSYALTDNSAVVVPNPGFWPKLDAKLADIEKQGAEGKKRLANFIGWNMISRTLEYLAKDYRDAAAEYQQKVTGKQAKDDPPASERCFDIVTAAMPLAMGTIFVRDVIPKGLKEKAAAMVNDIQEGFGELLHAATWMDNRTYEAARTKLRSMFNMVAYPSIMVKNISLIDAEYDDIVIEDSYTASMLQVVKYITIREFRRLTKPNVRYDPIKNTGDISEVNAFYEPTLNALTMTAAVLQPPFYDSVNPQYYNYGGIGTVIGHEVTHAFDSTGSNYDSEGARRSWWTDSTKSAYDGKTKGIMLQYNNYTIAAGKINGQLTLGENIADNGGTRAAYKGYIRYLERLSRPELIASDLRNYSPEQLFFISAGQVWCSKDRPERARIHLLRDAHSPEKWRVNGVMSNMAEFSQAFNCSSDAKMNPAVKQVVW